MAAPNSTSTSNLGVVGAPSSDGMTIGSSASEKAGFHGTAVVQAATVAAVATTGATNSSPYGFTTAAQADNLVAAVNSILVALKGKGILASS